MRIGIMLRSLDEQGGIGVYTRYLTEELLNIDRGNQYVLLYRNASHIGRFARYSNVSERVIKAPNKALWDQVAIPYACWKERLDVIFHPKFTVPLLAPCKAVMVVHGADWFIPEYARFYSYLDVAYIKTMLPLYCKRAAVVLSVSQLTTDHFNRILKLPPGKMRTVYFGPGKHFKRVNDPATLEKVKLKYDLPDRFILTLSKSEGGGRKNIEGVFKAYRLVHGKIPHKLVVGGKDCFRFRQEYNIPEDGYGGDILFPGWIDQSDLPAIYSLADLYLYPSNLEAFPIPITEAMACGTPIITSRANGLEEIAGSAALLVNPDDPEEIAGAVQRVLTAPGLQAELSAAGLERSRRFSWERCAIETLEILRGLVDTGPAQPCDDLL
jgi:glycosyltransferase involved in cell wall biosynthesis